MIITQTFTMARWKFFVKMPEATKQLDYCIIILRIFRTLVYLICAICHKYMHSLRLHPHWPPFHCTSFCFRHRRESSECPKGNGREATVNNSRSLILSPPIVSVDKNFLFVSSLQLVCSILKRKISLPISILFVLDFS